MAQQIADWVADSVLEKEDARRRAQVVKHLILVADVSQASISLSLISLCKFSDVVL